MVYLSLEKEFVDKNLEKWNKDAIEELGREGGKYSYLYYDDEKAKIDEIDEEHNRILIACETSKVGYISMEVELTAEDLLRLIEIAVKKLNKFKTILEGLK